MVPGCFIFTVSRSTQNATQTLVSLSTKPTYFSTTDTKNTRFCCSRQKTSCVSLSFARLATVLCLLATTCPKLPLLRDAERIDDALDDFAMMKRRSKRRRKHDDDDDEEEEEENSDDSDDDDSDDDDEESLLLIKVRGLDRSAQAMEHRRGGERSKGINSQKSSR